MEKEITKIRRKPIKLPSNINVSLQLKIWEMQELTREEDIMQMVKHYEMLARRVLNKDGYNILKGKNSKNLIHFERVYEVCRMKGWDTKLYIESQFDRVKYFKTFMRIPMPSQMYSVNAMRHFTNYLSSIKEKYAKDVDSRKKEKGKETQSIKAEVVSQIQNSIEMLHRYIIHTNYEDKSQYKAVKIFQSWQELSPYYLWTIPWFHGALKNMKGNKADLYRKEFDKINKSKLLPALIKQTVHQIESHFNIPPNIQL